MDFVVDLASQYKRELYWLGWLSVLTLTASVALIPWIAGRIPANYFRDDHNVSRGARTASWRITGYRWLRNSIAALLLLAGVLMLVLPGQGLLTILMALFVADLPGKHRFERKLIANPKLLASINWIRQQRGIAPLTPPGN